MLFAIGLYAQIEPDITGAQKIIQERQTEIWNIIQMSKEANLGRNGISNPDRIFPGQNLTFLFQDGFDTTIVVKAGDSQWLILARDMENLKRSHGRVIPWEDKGVDPPVEPIEPVQQEAKSAPWPWWVWIIVAYVFIGLVALVLKYLRDRERRNPVTAGKPQVPGGVSNSDAYNRMRTIAGERNPGARIEIRNIRRGLLSGRAKVFYASGKPKTLRLRKVHAYAGEASVNGVMETIYFLQGCGNDARSGNYMSGNDLEFTPEVTIQEDGSESPLPTVADASLPTREPEPIPSSEFHQRTSKALEIAQEFLKGNDAKHRVNIKIGYESLEVLIENKFDQPKKPTKPAEESKE